APRETRRLVRHPETPPTGDKPPGARPAHAPRLPCRQARFTSNRGEPTHLLQHDQIEQSQPRKGERHSTITLVQRQRLAEPRRKRTRVGRRAANLYPNVGDLERIVERALLMPRVVDQ